MITGVFHLLAENYDDKNDQLFPGRCSDELLKQVPPFALWTSEFDFLKRDSLKLAERGKKLGKLLDISNIPGVAHAFMGCKLTSDAYTQFDVEQAKGFNLWVRGKK